MLVLKFGGSSVANAERIRQVSEIIQKTLAQDPSICVIVSAFSGVTDLLISTTNKAENKEDYISGLKEIFKKSEEISSTLLHAEYLSKAKECLESLNTELSNMLYGIALIQEASSKTRDHILSFGERISASVINLYLQQENVSSRFIDARDYIKTDDNFGSARVLYEETYTNINNDLGSLKGVAMITGFIGSDISSGRTTTLGRGGSDYSAAIFAAALDADELQIWTDVSGFLSADPRKVKNAYTIEELSYNEALELSHFGAKVLYAPTVRPVREKGIPTRIKNTFEPEVSGTLIHSLKKLNGSIISGVSAINDIALVTMEGTGLQGVMGTAHRFFKALTDASINVIMITQASSEHSISVAILESQAELAKSSIENAFSFEIKRKLVDPIRIEEGLSLIAIVGENMKNRPGVAAKLFTTLGKEGINIEAIAQGSSELNISFAVSKHDTVKALNTIHDSFFLSETKTVHLFIVGVGLVGSTMLKMISENKEDLINESKLDIRIHAVSNSRKMLLSKEGIDPSEVHDLLSKSEQATDLSALIDQMNLWNFSNTIFIDNTASPFVPNRYLDILNHSISICTPNKIALSSDLNYYRDLKSSALRNNCTLNFETNVGAGLPVISTLNNMVNSGDKVFKIEAILSGSLSFIFNNYSSSDDFSSMVKRAKDEGYTEPDPRDDLSGMDAKRKLLILGRESGHDIEMSDIEIVPFIHEDCMNAETVDQFFELLEKEDPMMKNLLIEAENKNSKLRYIAQFENGKGKIALLPVSESSPFYNLNGSDNMIAFYSDRYRNTPLVIRGPGAGAEVTAAGLLAEIINIGRK